MGDNQFPQMMEQGNENANNKVRQMMGQEKEDVDKQVQETMDQNKEDAVNIFSQDEDFNYLQDKDELTELTGFVDQIHAAAVVGKKKLDLFKFYINNGGKKRILCLVWGKTLIEKHASKITVGQIIHIEKAYTKAVNQNYFNEINNLVPFELLINDKTTLEYLGMTDTSNPTGERRNVKDTTFENLGKTEGLISIEGHLKTEFFKNENQFKREIYGLGSITDGHYKVNIHVKNYSDIKTEKGKRIKVIGEVDQSAAGSMIVIVCRDSECIIECQDAEVMSTQQLARGVRTPKRGRE